MANPKNKWSRPLAPPAPMFFGEKERNLVKQINDELAERVLGQTIAYYPISIEESDFNNTYGESLEKTSLPPVRVYAYVVVENEQTNDRYGYEYQTKLTVNFHRKRLVNDQNLFVRVGDYVQYGDVFYEIVRTYNDTRYLFGQVEHKFQISAECVKAREGAFRVTPSVDRPTDRPTVSGEGQLAAPRPVPYPPLAATYITLASERKLPNERVLTAGAGITFVDSGPGSSLTLSGLEAQGPTGSLQFQQGASLITGSANLTFLSASSRLGIGTDSPSHSLTIIGNMSASSDVLIGGDVNYSGSLSGSGIARFGNDVYIAGTLHGGSPLKIAGSIQVVDTSNNGEVLASMGDVTGDGTVALSGSLVEATNLTASLAYLPDIVSTTLISASAMTATTSLWHNLTCSSFVSASLYFGDGRHLTNVTASAVEVADGPQYSLQFRYDSPIGREISGSSNLTFITSNNTLSLAGDLSASANISASYFYGDGRNLTNVTASAVEVADGPEFSIQFRYDSPIGREISGSSNLTFTTATNTLALAGDLSASANISASYFYGDGSNLTGIASTAKGTAGSLQFKTGSAEMTGSSAIVYDLDNNRLTIGGGLIHNRTAIGASHTASVSDYILGATSVPAEILMDATLFNNGQVLLVKDESGAAANSTSVTILPSGSQTVDGQPSLQIGSPHGSVLVYSDGSNWFVY